MSLVRVRVRIRVRVRVRVSIRALDSPEKAYFVLPIIDILFQVEIQLNLDKSTTQIARESKL
mgnify:CR=1 FL=1